MPFVKGRTKTGGRTKNGTARKATKFSDQLNAHRFNYPRELAEVLLELKNLRKSLGDFKLTGDKTKDQIEMDRRNSIVKELQFFYGELKSLLPYMAPKLREKEVETIDEPEDQKPSAPISDEDLIKALGNGQPNDNASRRDSKKGGAVPAAVQESAARPEEKLVGEESEEDL